MSRSSRTGQVQYSLMVDERGGILDDLLVSRHPSGLYGIVCNASNRAKVIAQLDRLRGARAAALGDQTTSTAMLAVQGPQALATVQKVVARIENGPPLARLKFYHEASGAARDDVSAADVTVSRTGYTGEDGFELIVPGGDASRLWEALLAAGREFGIRPCGLGARDTLRFEAAMPLYGHELSETINPFEAGLGRFVKLDKGEFVGREALRALEKTTDRKRIGLALEGKRIARQDQAVRHEGRSVGLVTSGTYSPTLDRSLAMAYVEPALAAPGARLTVDVRGYAVPATVVLLPFYHRAKP